VTVPEAPKSPRKPGLDRASGTVSKQTLVFDWKYHRPGFGKSGTGVLTVDGTEVARNRTEHSVPLIYAWDEAFNVGVDAGTPMSDKNYQVPIRFTGKIAKLTIKIGSEQALTAAMAEREQKLKD
jgi:arylsulfatase